MHFSSYGPLARSLFVSLLPCASLCIHVRGGSILRSGELAGSVSLYRSLAMASIPLKDVTRGHTGCHISIALGGLLRMHASAQTALMSMLTSAVPQMFRVVIQRQQTRVIMTSMGRYIYSYALRMQCLLICTVYVHAPATDRSFLIST